MSWGERSCINYGTCKLNPTMATCNVKCIGYNYDGVKNIDSKYMVTSEQLKEIKNK